MSFCKGFLRSKKLQNLSSKTYLSWTTKIFFSDFSGFSKLILSVRDMYRHRALNSAFHYVLDVFLQRTLIFKTIGKSLLQYIFMFEKWNVFSDFSGSLKLILSVLAVFSCRALNSASDHVFDIFLQWIFTCSKIRKAVRQYIVLFEM